MNIIDILGKIIRSELKDERWYSRICTATEINETTRTLDAVPIDGGATIFNVRMQASESKSIGLVQIPVTDSIIVVTFISKELAYVSLFTEIEKILIDTDLVQFNGGDLDGLVTINEITQKLNNMVIEVQAELVKIQAGLAGVGGVYTPGTIANFNKNDYENDNITQ
jgi:hypothetical protein